MAAKLQTLDTIRPLATEERETDVVRREYQDGVRHLEQKEYGQAALALHNALLGFEQRQDEPGIANASNQLGHVCLAREDFAGSRKTVAAERGCDRRGGTAPVVTVHRMSSKIQRCLFWASNQLDSKAADIRQGRDDERRRLDLCWSTDST